MDDIRQERSNEEPTSTKDLNKVTKQEISHIHQGIYDLSGLEKINSIAYLEVKLLAENPCQG